MFFISFLLFNLFVHSTAICSDGSTPYKTQCLYFEATKAAFFVGESVCNGYGGHLISIHTLADNMVISQLAGARFTESTESDFWFGATDIYSPSKWSWLDNSSFDFSNWDKGQPADTDGSDCGVVLMHGGKWKADDCYKEKPYVCAVSASDDVTNTTTSTSTTTTTTTTTATTTTTRSKTCPTSWTYYNTTGYCYVVLQSETWVNAEDRCKVENAHLASIHDINEDLFLAHLMGGQFQYVWIGLFTDDNNAHWSWTDGTPVDYVNWNPGEPNNPGAENCVTILVDASFNNWGCGHVTRYICKKLPS